ncbi:hypothetical protein TNCV_3445401 [Trichonephila clavipes]|nr:hypothetical protein TNCV_3445401 [Trichonephila clavipes]
MQMIKIRDTQLGHFKTVFARAMGYSTKSVDLYGWYCAWRCLGYVIGPIMTNCQTLREGLQQVSEKQIGRSIVMAHTSDGEI